RPSSRRCAGVGRTGNLAGRRARAPVPRRGGRRVWVANQGSGTISRVNPVTLLTTEQMRLIGPPPRAHAFGLYGSSNLMAGLSNHGLTIFSTSPPATRTRPWRTCPPPVDQQLAEGSRLRVAAVTPQSRRRGRSQ